MFNSSSIVNVDAKSYYFAANVALSYSFSSIYFDGSGGEIASQAVFAGVGQVWLMGQNLIIHLGVSFDAQLDSLIFYKECTFTVPEKYHFKIGCHLVIYQFVASDAVVFEAQRVSVLIGDNRTVANNAYLTVTNSLYIGSASGSSSNVTWYLNNVSQLTTTSATTVTVSSAIQSLYIASQSVDQWAKPNWCHSASFVRTDGTVDI